MVSGADAGFQRGLAPIIAVAVFAIIFYLLIRLAWRVIARRSPSGQNPNKSSNKKLRGARLNPQPDIAE